MGRNAQYFQHQAEKLSDEDGAATVVKERGTDCLYEYVATDGATYRGWLHDGESLADIQWRSEPKGGWPQELR